MVENGTPAVLATAASSGPQSACLVAPEYPVRDAEAFTAPLYRQRFGLGCRGPEG